MPRQKIIKEVNFYEVLLQTNQIWLLGLTVKACGIQHSLGIPITNIVRARSQKVLHNLRQRHSSKPNLQRLQNLRQRYVSRRKLAQYSSLFTSKVEKTTIHNKQVKKKNLNRPKLNQKYTEVYVIANNNSNLSCVTQIQRTVNNRLYKSIFTHLCKEFFSSFFNKGAWERD